MPKTYRATQQWDHWLTQFLGMKLLAAEQRFLQKILATYYGKHMLLIGVPKQHQLLTTSVTTFQTLLTPLNNRNVQIQSIESDFYELPILSESVDLVLLPHTLDYLHNPHQLLTESCRIVKPQGHIVIFGFNPWSFWGLKKLMTRSKKMPWSADFIPPNTVKKWLRTEEFSLVKQATLLFRPPSQTPSVFRQLKFMEWLGQKCYIPFGGVYLLVAEANVKTLTPIKLRWQQKLSSAGVSAMPGHTMRDYYL